MARFDDKSWRQMMDYLKDTYPAVCRHWFSDLTPDQMDSGLLKIHTQGVVQRNYLQRNCREYFAEAAQQITSRLITVEFTCDPVRPAAKRAEASELAATTFDDAEQSATNDAILDDAPAVADAQVHQEAAVGSPSHAPQHEVADSDHRPANPLNNHHLPTSPHANPSDLDHAADPDVEYDVKPGQKAKRRDRASVAEANLPTEPNIAYPSSGANLSGAAPTVFTSSNKPHAAQHDYDHNDDLVLIPDNTFENFISGPNNQLAYAASIAVANQPGVAYNPLFIHGGVGLGKTHLLQAICQQVINNNPATRIAYVSCETFTNQFIECVQAGKMSEFHQRFRNVDMLVIDDVHFLANRERTQEEFFHTFNELFQSNRQIVLSSDAAPGDIPDLEERLVSRFNWGLVANVLKPGFDTRVAILHAKSKIREFTIPEDVVQYVAHAIDSNARELEGAINKLQAFVQLTKRDLTLEVAREALDLPQFDAPRSNQVTLQNIIDVVTGYYNVKLSDLQSKRRHKSITEPRQVCMWLARQTTRFSLEEIGGHFGGRDHTTVMHSVNIVEKRGEEDPAYQRTVQQLLNQVKHENGLVGDPSQS